MSVVELLERVTTTRVVVVVGVYRTNGTSLCQAAVVREVPIAR